MRGDRRWCWWRDQRPRWGVVLHRLPAAFGPLRGGESQYVRSADIERLRALSANNPAPQNSRISVHCRFAFARKSDGNQVWHTPRRGIRGGKRVYLRFIFLAHDLSAPTGGVSFRLLSARGTVK
jgi:hypothetical protein